VQPVNGITSQPATPPRPVDAALARAARDLEASFLSVMLKEAGVGAPRASFGGGAGEEQFASFLTQAYAEGMAERGGIGLAEAIFRTLQERADDAA
jgi:Rod binding domain-containing protein